MPPVVLPEFGIKNSAMQLKRYAFTSDALRERELQWWATFGADEERYFWGLTDSWQPPARVRYIDRMAAYLADCQHVVDYGCGSGWMTRGVADRMQRPVTGIDFSPEQIALAAQANADCPWTLFMAITGVEQLPPAQGYVFHGVMHHLSQHEIHHLLERLSRLAPRGARMVFVEPVCYPGNKPDERDRVLLDAIEEIVTEPWRVAREQGVALVPSVQAARQRQDERWWGAAPHGPSPMEKPFEGRELDDLLSSYFDTQPGESVQYLPASQGLASELALLRDCNADLADTLATQLMPQVDALERVLMRMPRLPDSGWFLRMVQARVR